MANAVSFKFTVRRAWWLTPFLFASRVAAIMGLPVDEDRLMRIAAHGVRVTTTPA